MTDKAKFFTGTLTPPGVSPRKRPLVIPKQPPELVALRKKQHAEMERNAPIFDKQYDKLLKKHRGHYAVMRDGKILGIFPTVGEAAAVGERCPGGVFSLHEIDDTPIDLGIFSCV